MPQYTPTEAPYLNRIIWRANFKMYDKVMTNDKNVD